MSKSLQVDIISPEQTLFSGQAQSIVALGVIGALGIYPGHAPLVTMLKPGWIRVVQKSQKEEKFYALSGILEVRCNVVWILVDAT